jgi:hypothetical protein
MERVEGGGGVVGVTHGAGGLQLIERARHDDVCVCWWMWWMWSEVGYQ